MPRSLIMALRSVSLRERLQNPWEISMSPGADILAVVKSYGIPSEFPVRVMNQAMRVPDHVLEADWDGRDWT